ncbi:hypothetical protein JW865_01810 [Candidatus Bathyarchaeota archaeon]|nr:hypothetical protein [Candidatus Bathyarchaeota archaeon]
MVITIFIFKSSIYPNSRFFEGLRITAAFVGMDHLPLILFIDDALEVIIKGRWGSDTFWDYLKTSSDLAGFFVIDSNLKKFNIQLTDLDPSLNIQLITINEFIKSILEAKVVTTF